MVNHGSLILPLLSTPGTVGVACIVPKGIGIMDAHASHDLLETPWQAPPLEILALWAGTARHS